MLVASGEIQWPGMFLSQLAIGSPASLTLDSTSDAVAWVGFADFTGNIATIYFRTGTVTTGADVDVRIETVVNGRPSGTLWATNTNVVVNVASSDDNVWKTATLTAQASINRGDLFAIVIASSAGSPNIILTGTFNSGNWEESFPLVLQNATGSYAAPAGGVCSLNWVVELATTGVIPMPRMMPCNSTAAQNNITSSSSPDELALRFRLPFRARCIGMRAMLYNVSAGADFTFSLWDATGDQDVEALAQKQLDGDASYTTGHDGTFRMNWNTPVTLEADTTYYLGVRPDTGNSITVPEFQVTGGPTNAMRGWPVYPDQVYRSARTWTTGTAGAWTDTTTSLMPFALILDQIDNGAAGGGPPPDRRSRGWPTRLRPPVFGR